MCRIALKWQDKITNVDPMDRTKQIPANQETRRWIRQTLRKQLTRQGNPFFRTHRATEIGQDLHTHGE